MSDLSNFPALPEEGFVTVREENGEMVSVPKSDVDDIQLPLYPEVDMSHDLLKPSVSKETAKSAFLEHNETQSKRLWHAWYEHGVTGVLEELANSTQSTDKVWLCKTACGVLGAVRWANSLHGTLFPHYSMSNDEIISEFSRNPQWKESPVRCFTWHPHTQKYAVSLRDDSIRIHQAARPDLVPILKHKLQKGVANMAWRPNSASQLAVACHSCILLWNIEPTSLATRPSSSAASVLTYPGHCPVTSLSWSPCGSLLVSGSATCTVMLVWDVSKSSCVPLRRWGGGGVSLVSFSPDGSKVLAACPSAMFRLWETQTWSCETWTKLYNRIQCASWGPEGTVLLFACAGESVIHSVTFKKSAEVKRADICSTNQAVVCANLAPVEVTATDGRILSVGGPVQNMVWDSTGERLAVQFSGTGGDIIAVYQTRIKPVLELIPCGFIKGQKGESPVLMVFQPHFSQGALLTLVWSSGRVSHIPMYFISRTSMETAGLNRTQTLNGPSLNRSLYTV